MNIFIIPSWYPSKSNPIYGTFNREQANLLARNRSNWNIGVSRWGQGDSDFLLPVLSASSYFKVLKTHQPYIESIEPNFKEYFFPAFTWTRKFLNGNIRGIYKANEENLKCYSHDFGKPDLISVQATYPGALVAQQLSTKYQIPYVVTIRMSPFPFDEFINKDGTLKELIYSPLKNANGLIATSRSLKNRLNQFGFNQVSVQNNPIDTNFFTPHEPNMVPSMLTIGRIEEQKGIDILLKAFSKINTPYRLRIGGNGSKLSEFKRLATQLKIEKKVSWLGELSRDEVRSEMQKCSFYVLSSRHETFGNVVLEAMACGKPVVATRCGGPEEIVIPELGYLADINSNDLADKIEKMINTHSKFKSEVIREIAERNYSPEQWVAKLETIFKAI